MTTFAEALAKRNQIDALLVKLGENVENTGNAAAKRLGVPLKGPMGLTHDEVKTDPAYRAAKSAFDHAQAKAREYNQWFVKAFKKEYRAHIDAERQRKSKA